MLLHNSELYYTLILLFYRLKFDPNRPVRELSCDMPVSAPVAVLCLPEEKLLKKLAATVDEDTINFIRAKEQFKATLTFPGILFRYPKWPECI